MYFAHIHKRIHNYKYEKSFEFDSALNIYLHI
jgi:hypothetical protein